MGYFNISHCIYIIDTILYNIRNTNACGTQRLVGSISVTILSDISLFSLRLHGVTGRYKHKQCLSRYDCLVACVHTQVLSYTDVWILYNMSGIHVLLSAPLVFCAHLRSTLKQFVWRAIVVARCVNRY